MGRNFNPVGWFEIPVKDMERACDFYGSIFGFNMEPKELGGVSMAWFPVEGSATGAAGSLVRAEGYEPSSSGVLVYFTAPDMDGMLSRVQEAGGRVLQWRTGIGEYGFVAYIMDTEGNRIGLHSRT